MKIEGFTFCVMLSCWNLKFNSGLHGAVQNHYPFSLNIVLEASVNCKMTMVGVRSHANSMEMAVSNAGQKVVSYNFIKLNLWKCTVGSSCRLNDIKRKQDTEVMACKVKSLKIYYCEL